ncbi:hydroxymethylpyrimidine/phosphomethylpyrimidine kinase [Rhabdochromatium marinum]|nr:hydroxymethylpyrimidine/phosphomethylpyrimidine kinase [Rhabdochromatium marinum]
MLNMKAFSSAPRDPILLAIGGHDPGGGAGLQADIETAAALGLHCCTAITCITVQTSCRLTQVIPQPPEQLRDQCQAVFSDYKVAAIKIGLIGHSNLIQTIGALLDAHSSLPVVFDPVLAAGSGEHIVDAALLNQLRLHLLRRCTLITPNLPEAGLLADVAERDQAARQLLRLGAKAVLITGTHDASAQVINTFYPANAPPSQWEWPRLPGSFHGSGCTLASAVAARLALGMPLETAIIEAQQYVIDSLRQARALARCQLIPQRLFATRHAD